MSLAETTTFPTLSCMLLPLSSNDVLLPKSVVKDVVYKPAINLYQEEENDWLIGDIEWDECVVPVLSFERLCNQPRVVKTENIRAVICHVLDHSDSLPFYAIEAQSMPRPLIMDSRALNNHEGMMSKHSELIAYHVKVGSKELTIPNFQRLEEILITRSE